MRVFSVSLTLVPSYCESGGREGVGWLCLNDTCGTLGYVTMTTWQCVCVCSGGCIWVTITRWCVMSVVTPHKCAPQSERLLWVVCCHSPSHLRAQQALHVHTDCLYQPFIHVYS